MVGRKLNLDHFISSKFQFLIRLQISNFLNWWISKPSNLEILKTSDVRRCDGDVGVGVWWRTDLKRCGEEDINDADVAQLGEHETEDLRVAGSIPAISTFLILTVWSATLKIKPNPAFLKK